MNHPSPSLPDHLAALCASVQPTSQEKKEEAQKHLDSLTKPQGSLGRLEDMARQLFAIQERFPLQPSPARMFTIAADHGIAREGIAACPIWLTRRQCENFLDGGGSINSLCAAAGADVWVVDVGIDCDPMPARERFVDRKIARGSANMSKGPAMTLEECAEAVQVGIDLARQARQDGINVVGTGEMGIGNTSPSTAMFCAYLGFSVEEMTGMGAGYPPEGREHKVRLIKRALEVNADAIASGDPFRIMAAVGGLEIAALTGLIIGGALMRQAVMIDGFIATAAYVAAERLAPAVRDYCYFSHGSAESGHGLVLARLGEKPLLDLGMRVGEGTGAAVAMQLLSTAACFYNNMTTFEKAGIVL